LKIGGYFDSDIVIANAESDYRITKGSLKKLFSSTNQLNQEIISAYGCLINERNKKFSLNNTYVLPTYFYTLIEDTLKRGDYSYKKTERVLSRSKVNLKHYKMIVTPINLGGYSWILLVADMVND
jgi:Ulp1 family protease